MFRIGTPELAVNLLIVVVIFGSSQVPALGQGLSQAEAQRQLSRNGFNETWR